MNLQTVGGGSQICKRIQMTPYLWLAVPHPPPPHPLGPWVPLVQLIFLPEPQGWSYCWDMEFTTSSSLCPMVIRKELNWYRLLKQHHKKTALLVLILFLVNFTMHAIWNYKALTKASCSKNTFVVSREKEWKTRFNCHYSYANMTCRGHVRGGVRAQTGRDKSITKHLTWNTVWFSIITARRRLNGIINGFHATKTRPHLESSRVCVSQQAHQSVRNCTLMGTYNHVKGCAVWGYWNVLISWWQ